MAEKHMLKIRIKLKAFDHRILDQSTQEITEVALRTGARINGPIPLPTRRMVIPTRKTPCGQGSESWDKWEMRVHKRLIDIDADERAIRQIMRVRIPDSVYIEIELTG